MPQRFNSFICLAEMRTGSNFLEENLNEIPGLRSWGEAFNPHFIGHAGMPEMAGITLDARENDPISLLKAMRAQTDGMAGFRFFHDHDPRVLDHCLADPCCAKIILNRNPLDSYVSLKIALQTNQWRMSDMKSARRVTVDFDAADFQDHIGGMQAFQLSVLKRLQISGQTAFYIGYEDVGDIDVLNGLATFLGLENRIKALSEKTKVQNPSSLRDKVTNFDEMTAALGDVDHFALSRMPNFEPRRGPNVPSYIGAMKAPLLYMPIKGGPEGSVAAWLAELDSATDDQLLRGMTQKGLRKWKRTHPGHRTFTVLRHPADRAHAVFCKHILMPGPDCFDDIRYILRERYRMPIPAKKVGKTYDIEAHREAFISFLIFLRGNLGGQTSLRVDPVWASQSTLVQGMGQFVLPDAILREDDLPTGLPALARTAGIEAVCYAPQDTQTPHTLDDIYNDEIDGFVRDVYQRDFMMFGFGGRSA